MSVSDKLLIDAIKNYKVKTINIVNDVNSEINSLVNKIFVINLIEDSLKRNYIITLMKKYKINYTLVIVDRISSELHKNLCYKKSLISKSELGCCLSHLWCLNQIISNKYENAIIFEDDIILHKNFTKSFIKIFNPSFDFFLLGAHDFHFSTINYKNLKNNLYKPSPNGGSSQVYGAHANYYSLKAAKRMFAIRVSEISFFDKEYALMFNYYKDTSFICYPNLCASNISESTLDHKRELLSDQEYEYYKKCHINFNFKNYNFIYLNLLPYYDYNQLTENFDYESFIEKCLYNYSHNYDTIQILKTRLVMDFFTIKEILSIVGYNNYNNYNSLTNTVNDSSSVSNSVNASFN